MHKLLLSRGKKEKAALHTSEKNEELPGIHKNKKQSSLVYTKLHLNPYWCLLLESFLLLHALPLRESPYGYFSLFPASYGTLDRDAPFRAYLSGTLVILCITQVCVCV